MFNLPIALMLACTYLGATDAGMTADERSKALNWMEESRKAFLAAIDGVTDQQWKWVPAPGRWSVGQVAEHIVLAEAGLFANVKTAQASPVNPAWEEKTKGKTEMLVAVLAPRLGKAQAPEQIVPHGEMTLDQVRERFEKQRLEIVKFTTETDLPLKEHTVENPFFKTLNGYQWLIYSPLHTMRHVKQLAEVKGTTGYPK